MRGARSDAGSGFTPIAALAALAAVAAVAMVVFAIPATATAASNYWLEHRPLNITHQGGEDEAPSATMYAFDRSMKLGSDMLEVDVNTTKDGRLAIIHDGTVDRTTNGTGPVAGMTMAQLKRLDAAYWFVPIAGLPHDGADDQYVFRGVRTGEKKPPRGYKRKDFRTLELDELMDKYPDVPINIEIKGGAAENNASYLHVADALAAYLNKLGRTKGIMVASFNDAAITRFHELAPKIDLAPATAGVATYVLAGMPPPPGTAAFQVPTSFSGVPVVTPDFVKRAHRDNYGVHVWTINDEPTMNELLDWDVDGIMSAEPARLEKVLCERGAKRPPLPASSPGRHCSPNVSIACEVKAKRLLLNRRKARVILVRRDDYASRCAGRIALRGFGTKARKSARFDFGWGPPSENGPKQVVAKLKLSKKLKRSIRRSGKARATVHPYSAFVVKRKLKLG